MKFIYVRWFDANFNTGGKTTEEILNDNYFVLETVGIYVGEDDKYISLATEYCDKTKDWRHSHNIPKVNILERRWLRMKKKEVE